MPSPCEYAYILERHILPRLLGVARQVIKKTHNDVVFAENMCCSCSSIIGYNRSFKHSLLPCMGNSITLKAQIMVQLFQTFWLNYLKEFGKKIITYIVLAKASDDGDEAYGKAVQFKQGVQYSGFRIEHSHSTGDSRASFLACFNLVKSEKIAVGRSSVLRYCWMCAPYLASKMKKWLQKQCIMSVSLKKVTELLNELNPSAWENLLPRIKGSKNNTKNGLSEVTDLIYDKAAEDPN
ncbi:hypothetical protein OUZ56_015149 [Daphnia magna]|uniref:Cc8L18.2-like protein n=1 Tax=Daphnia magna TaxID=35525 RepID=A0ABR0ALX5_9CRUS|nr:hypothetical protein OUZ56_015149 [Daphnia magna]